jgi:hypothetical protein
LPRLRQLEGVRSSVHSRAVVIDFKERRARPESLIPGKLLLSTGYDGSALEYGKRAGEKAAAML